MVLSLFLLGGCHGLFQHRKSPTSTPVFSAQDDFNSSLARSRVPQLDQTYQQTPLVAPTVPALPVVEGKLPLIYLSGQAASVRIVDETDRSTVLAQDVVANTIIAVDAARGVTIGGKRAIGYPLPGDHRYSIYLDTDSGPSVFQRGTIRPGAPAPATLPRVFNVKQIFPRASDLSAAAGL